MHRQLVMVALSLAIAGCRPSGSLVSAPRVVHEDAQILSERASVECGGAARRAHCELVAVHELTSDARAELELVIVSENVGALTLRGPKGEVPAVAGAGP